MKNAEILKASLIVESLVEIIIEGNQKICRPIDDHSVTNCIDETEESTIFFVVIFFCGQEANELKGRKLFLIK